MQRNQNNSNPIPISICFKQNLRNETQQSTKRNPSVSLFRNTWCQVFIAILTFYINKIHSNVCLILFSLYYYNIKLHLFKQKCIYLTFYIQTQYIYRNRHGGMTKLYVNTEENTLNAGGQFRKKTFNLPTEIYIQGKYTSKLIFHSILLKCKLIAKRITLTWIKIQIAIGFSGRVCMG